MSTNPGSETSRAGMESSTESTFEFVSRSMYETSDDDGNTLSVASADARGSDDLSSFGDIDDDGFRSDESDSSSEDELDATPQVSYHPDAASERPHPPESDSDMESSTPDSRKGPAVYMELSEARLGDGSGAVDLCRVVSEYNAKSSTPPVLSRFGYPDLRVVVKMPLAREWLPSSTSYRVLYVGPIASWLVEEINTHIGAALSVTPTSSRFHIFQTFTRAGTASSSGVQLERAGAELIVDHCPGPVAGCTAQNVPSATVALNDGSQITFGEDGTIRPKSASLPDLVVFGHPGADVAGDPVEIRFAFNRARSIIKSLGIPSLDITAVPNYQGRPVHFQTSSLKMCVEGRHNKDQEYEILKALPVDHTAFIGIDPVHLNMHLAYLKERSKVKGGPPYHTSSGKSALANIRKRLKLSAPAINYRDIVRLLIGLILGILVIEAGLWSLSYRNTSISEALTSDSPNSLPSPSIKALKATSVVKSPSVTPTLNIPKDLTVLPPKQHSGRKWRNLLNRTKEETVGNSTVDSISSECVLCSLETMSEQLRRLESLSEQAASLWSKEIMRQIRKRSAQASELTRYCADRVWQKTQPLRTASYKDEILSRIQESSLKAQALRRYYEDRVWQETRPLRTSPYMLEVREQALRLRCNIEARLGKRDSRSCKLLQDIQSRTKKR